MSPMQQPEPSRIRPDWLQQLQTNARSLYSIMPTFEKFEACLQEPAPNRPMTLDLSTFLDITGDILGKTVGELFHTRVLPPATDPYIVRQCLWAGDFLAIAINLHRSNQVDGYMTTMHSAWALFREKLLEVISLQS